MTSHSKIHISTNIRTIRKAYGYTQKGFAERFNVCRAAISTYELGKINPSYEFLISVSKFCGISVHDIVVNIVVPADFEYNLVNFSKHYKHLKP